MTSESRKSTQPGKARAAAVIQWLPAERLGQLSMDAQVRPWLIGKGLPALGRS